MKQKSLLMIVDDDPIIIILLRSILEEQYQIISFNSGEQVIEYFAALDYVWPQSKSTDDYPSTAQEDPQKNRYPDLILLDITMPGMDGYDVCAWLKAQHELASIPVIFVTGMIQTKYLTRGFKIGAVDYVPKPFNTDELMARVSTHLALKKARENLASQNILLERQILEIKEKTAQLRQRDTELLKLDRIAGLGTLAAGIAHEINTPLSFLKSSANSLKKTSEKMAIALYSWQGKPESKFILSDYTNYLEKIGFSRLSNSINSKYDRIERGIDRIRSIVDSLRSFSRVDMEAEGLLNIDQSIEEALSVLLAGGKEITIEKRLNQPPPIKCIPNEINQCLLHLLKNAFDAIEQKGMIIIETNYDPTLQRLTVTIEDNGSGMTDEVLKQAFNPFYTTKPVGQGTGVGLSICEHIMAKHQGKIELHSCEGEGATASFWLPYI